MGWCENRWEERGWYSRVGYWGREEEGRGCESKVWQGKGGEDKVGKGSRWEARIAYGREVMGVYGKIGRVR